MRFEWQVSDSGCMLAVQDVLSNGGAGTVHLHNVAEPAFCVEWAGNGSDSGEVLTRQSCHVSGQAPSRCCFGVIFHVARPAGSACAS